MKMATTTKKKAAAYRSTRDGVLIAALTNMVSMHLSFQTKSVSYTCTKRIILPRLLRLPWRRSGRLGEHAAADHHSAAIEHRRLPRSRPGERLPEPHQGAPRAATFERDDGRRRRAVAQLHEQAAPVAQPAVHEVPYRDLAHVELVPAADDDFVVGRPALEYEQRLSRRQAEAAPLADRVPPVPPVRTKHRPVAIDDGARPGLHTALVEEALIAVDGEADLLALGLGRDGQSRRLRGGARLALGRLPEGELEPCQHLRRDRPQHVGCLLYTSDAADEEDSVDLGGRRIIKKKKQKCKNR